MFVAKSLPSDAKRTAVSHVAENMRALLNGRRNLMRMDQGK